MADEKTESKYARKVRAGNQMYGPGCCGTINARKVGAEVEKNRDRWAAHLRATNPQNRSPRYANS